MHFSLSVFMEPDVPVNMLARLETGHFNGSKRPGLLVHTPITSITIIFTYAFCACSRSALLSLTGSGMSWRDNYCGVGLPSQAYVFPSNSFWLWGDGPSSFASTAFLDQAPADTGDSVWIIRTWSPSVFFGCNREELWVAAPLMQHSHGVREHTGSHYSGPEKYGKTWSLTRI